MTDREVAIIPTDAATTTGLARLAADIRAEAAAAADRAAAHYIFGENWMRLAKKTRARHEADLAAFALYLGEVRAVDPAKVVEVGARLPYHPDAWRNTTWGLVQGFVEWQIAKGFAIGTINVRLGTVKRYCKLAMTAGAIDAETFQRISALRGYGGTAARNVDERRREQQIPTRVGPKKANATPLDDQQVAQLKGQQPDTPIGRRDTLLMCLLLDHGLRVGEVAELTLAAINLDEGTISFYRRKVHLSQVHRLTRDTRRAARRHLQADRAGADPTAPLLMGGAASGELEGTFGVRAIQLRVGQLGRIVGASGLSPHDCRHRWATMAAQAGTSITDLRDAGGWSNLTTPNRYVERAKIANQGVRLTRPLRRWADDDHEGEE